MEPNDEIQSLRLELQRQNQKLNDMTGQVESMPTMFKQLVKEMQEEQRKVIVRLNSDFDERMAAMKKGYEDARRP